MAGKKRELVAHWPDPSVEAIKKQEMMRKGGFDDIHIVSYGDELHLPAIELKDDEFAKWMKDKGVVYDGEIKYTTDKKSPLYYYSQIAAKEKGAAKFAEGTAYYKSKGILTGVNYSPHANYLVSEIDYIRPFKLKALSMPWTEDYAWQIAEFSPQIVSYLASGVRAGAKYDDLPIHMYVMPHSPGQIPEGFRRSYYASIAHGAKIINYFCATPSAVGNTENYVDSYDLKMWKEIYTCTHEAGIFEDYILDGKVRQAKVGLLLSSTDELITGVNNFSLALHNNERKGLFFAPRHAQIPVDFLSEDDVIDGRAKDYKIIYVTQQYLQSKCLDALEKWCEKGGTVIAMVGGGYWNEFQKENPAAEKFYGERLQNRYRPEPRLQVPEEREHAALPEARPAAIRPTRYGAVVSQGIAESGTGPEPATGAHLWRAGGRLEATAHGHRRHHDWQIQGRLTGSGVEEARDWPCGSLRLPAGLGLRQERYGGAPGGPRAAARAIRTPCPTA